MLASRLAGDAAGYSSILVGGIGAALIFLLQLALYRMTHNRLLFSIFLVAAICLTLAWFIFFLFMPILWMDALPAYAKLIVVSILLFLYAVNFLKCREEFLSRRSAGSDPLPRGRFNRAKGTIAGEKIVLSLKHEPNLYIPGLPPRYSTAVGVPLVVHMLLGLNFRDVYPVFSAFAWGIPSAVITSFIFQLIGQKMGEARKVQEIQAELKVDLQSA